MGNNKLKNLIEIFNNSFFRIPDYQRGYAWKEVQFIEFWEDLEILKDDSYHYTGLLTVEKIEKKQVEKLEKWQDDLWMFSKGLNAYYVIDGQQRLTTIIILLNEILNRFDDYEIINYQEKNELVKSFLYHSLGELQSFVFGYERDNPSDEYFKTKILNQTSITVDTVPEETLYTANLNKAKAFFKNKLDELTKEQLEKLFSKVVKNLKFNFYEIDEELDVFVTFETMNNRGKPLSKLELLKNRLIYLTTLLSVDDRERIKLRKDINEVWKVVYEYLGKNQNAPLDDDEFLRNHWMMFFKYDRSKSEAYADFLLNEYFIPKNIIKNNTGTIIGYKEIKTYIDSIQKSIKSWYYIFNPTESKLNVQAKTWLLKLNRLGMGAFPPLLLVALNKEVEENKLVELLQNMERFQFLIFRLTRRASNTLNSYFYRLANDYHKERDGITISEIINEIAWSIDGEDEKDYYGWLDIERFEAYITDQYRKANGYYSWNGLRYLLFEYELYLKEQANGEMKVSWENVSKGNSIEHILPQSHEKACWKEGFDQYSEKEIKQLVHSLGNLVLISNIKNSRLQNNCFENKKIYNGRDGKLYGYVNGSYSEIQVAQNTKWTAESILERGIRILEFMEERWEIEIEGKQKFLGLDFVKDSVGI